LGDQTMMGRASKNRKFGTPDHPQTLSHRILIRPTEFRRRDRFSTGVRGTSRRS
jgi:hypothetical protein